VKYNWNWGVLLQPSPDGSGHTYFETLLVGLEWTLVTALCAWILALSLGTCVGIARTLPSPMGRRLASGYVQLFRSIPFIVQLFLWFFVLPELLPKAAGAWLKQLPNASFLTVVVGLGCYMSARIAEQLRAAIEAMPKGQRAAAMALGMRTAQVYRYVLMPMAFRHMLPPLTSELLNTIKNTSVALVIGLVELTANAYAMQEQSFQVFEAFSVATVLYLIVNMVVTFAMRALERAVAIPGYIAGK
jgi:glutamate/aspartate transport system permease protein